MEIDQPLYHKRWVREAIALVGLPYGGRSTGLATPFSVNLCALWAQPSCRVVAGQTSGCADIQHSARPWSRSLLRLVASQQQPCAIHAYRRTGGCRGSALYPPRLKSPNSAVVADNRLGRACSRRYLPLSWLVSATASLISPTSIPYPFNVRVQGFAHRGQWLFRTFVPSGPIRALYRLPSNARSIRRYRPSSVDHATRQSEPRRVFCAWGNMAYASAWPRCH